MSQPTLSHNYTELGTQMGRSQKYAAWTMVLREERYIGSASIYDLHVPVRFRPEVRVVEMMHTDETVLSSRGIGCPSWVHSNPKGMKRGQKSPQETAQLTY